VVAWCGSAGGGIPKNCWQLKSEKTVAYEKKSNKIIPSFVYITIFSGFSRG
jgi:hypothetical protein